MIDHEVPELPPVFDSFADCFTAEMIRQWELSQVTFCEFD